MEEIVDLKKNNELELKNGLKIILKDIIEEQIAEFLPGYPGGSGVVVELSISLGEKSTMIRLEQLPEGYESHLEKECEGFIIRLVNIIHDDMVRISVRKPET